MFHMETEAMPVLNIRDISGCARCGENHSSVSFCKFQRPIIISGEQYDYWALCPSTAQPIIMKVLVVGEEA